MEDSLTLLINSSEFEEQDRQTYVGARFLDATRKRLLDRFDTMTSGWGEIGHIAVVELQAATDSHAEHIRSVRTGTDAPWV